MFCSFNAVGPRLTYSLILLLMLLSIRVYAAQPSYYYPVAAIQPKTVTTDVCIYGATSAGVIAAVQCARLGKSVALVEFGTHAGGMTAAGLSRGDVNNAAMVGGLAQEFYTRVGTVYASSSEIFSYEPHVASNTFNDMLASSHVTPYYQQRLQTADVDNGRILSITMENGNVFKAKEFIDATYEGDLLAQAGVVSTIGREGRATYKESLAGVYQFYNDFDFKTAVDPYVVAGDPGSGLLPGISASPLQPLGTADSLVQAYNFRLCTSTNAGDSVVVSKPAGYNSSRYALLARYIADGYNEALSLLSPLPNLKFDLNDGTAIGTDDIGESASWATVDYSTREKIFQDHVSYDQGLLYFLNANEGAGVRLAADEFADTNNWPDQLYVREGRRMVSAYVMTQADCDGTRQAVDPVAMGSYDLDCHTVQRIVDSGVVHNEGAYQYAVKPYPVSCRSIVPYASQCTNLTVPICISASHVAFSSMRVEPMYMMLAQAAADISVAAINNSVSVQDVDYIKLRAELLSENQILSSTQTATPVPAKIFATPATIQGGQAGTLTAVLQSPAPAGGTTVTIYGQSTELTCPATIYVPPGSTQATVSFSTAAVKKASNVVFNAASGGQSVGGSLAVLITILHPIPFGLSLVSLPGNYTNVDQNLADILTGIVTPAGASTTVMAWWDPISGTYRLTPAAPADFPRVGYGYWARFGPGTESGVIAAGEPITSPTQPISLNKGWNMVGDPYGAPVAISGLQVSDASGTKPFLAAAAAGLISPQLYSWSGTVYVPNTAGESLMPYSGYWLEASEACQLIVPSS